MKNDCLSRSGLNIFEKILFFLYVYTCFIPKKYYITCLNFSAFLYPYSDSSKYPEGNITVNKLPAVPSVPTGSLDNSRDGAVVTAKNLNAFFEAFKQEFAPGGGNGAYRAVPEAEEGVYSEELKHGRVSGYWTGKLEGVGKREGEWYTERMEYHDYSNHGYLYFGGGYVRVLDVTLSNSSRREMLLNGKMNFNGKFKGELVFDNFKYKYEKYGNGSEDTTYSGSVKIGTLDITEKYMLEVDEEIRDYW